MRAARQYHPVQGGLLEKLGNPEKQLTCLHIAGTKGRCDKYEDLICPLLGEHQARNAGVAVGMVEVLAEQGYKIDASAIRAGIAQVCWPGRLQIVSKEPTIVLDGAHDAASAAELSRAIQSLFPNAKITLVLGISADKDVVGIAAALCPLAEKVIITASKSPRSSKPEELLQRLAPYCAAQLAANTAAALELAKKNAEKDTVILATGSLYLVGEAMQALGIE